MVQLTALYGHPQDTEAFDRYYRQIHGPLAQKLPGLKGFTYHKPISADPQEKSPYYLIADLYFEDMASLQAAFASPEGQAAAGDLQNFASGGCTLVVGEVQVLDSVSLS